MNEKIENENNNEESEPKTFQDICKETGWGLGQKPKEGEEKYFGQAIGQQDDFEPDEKDLKLLWR